MKRTNAFASLKLVLAAATLFGLPSPVVAQPSWPATGATILDYSDPGGTTSVQKNKRINMDMFGYYLNGATQLAPDDELIAVAFDDVPGGMNPDVVNLVVWDVGANIWRAVQISGANQPDVVLLDDPVNPGSKYWAALVYNAGGDIMLEYYEITGIATANLAVTKQGSTITVSNTSSVSDNPHIDAAPDLTQSFTPSSGLPDPLYEMTHFAITWHEFSAVGANEIWTGFDNGFPTNTTSTAVTNKMIVDDGGMSDVAFARVEDNVNGLQYYKAYYINTSSTVIHHADITDVYAAVPTLTNNYPVLEVLPVVSPPRIDAGNVQILNNANDDRWQAVIAVENVFSPWNSEIHSYGTNGSGVTITNYSDASFMTSNPLTNEQAYSPAVATAANQLGWTGGSAFAGNTDYLMGFFFDYPSTAHDYFLAVTQSGTSLAPQLGYQEVNDNSVSAATLTTSPNEPALALSYGTNTGYASTAAFSDGSTVYVKKPRDYNTTSPVFKTTDIAAMTVPRGFAIYPNPAQNWISISGLDGEHVYTITDMLGKQHAQGTIGKAAKVIDVASLPTGIYNVSVSHNNTVKHAKFVKQ